MRSEASVRRRIVTRRAFWLLLAESTWRGPIGEEAVAAFLRERGFAIVAQNLRVGHLELDIVARRGALVVIVEVRTRGQTAWTSGFGSMTAEKRRRVRRAGERLWQRRYKNDETVERLRFDAASVVCEADGSIRVEYAEAAF